ncbi:MAG: hypothetical protein J7513_16075 [Solirubrobacteraceae bacterium]|nr:hypothetical protein [Solirubrobacteraceae bacterium]
MIGVLALCVGYVITGIASGGSQFLGVESILGTEFQDFDQVSALQFFAGGAQILLAYLVVRQIVAAREANALVAAARAAAARQANAALLADATAGASVAAAAYHQIAGFAGEVAARAHAQISDRDREKLANAETLAFPYRQDAHSARIRLRAALGAHSDAHQRAQEFINLVDAQSRALAGLRRWADSGSGPCPSVDALSKDSAEARVACENAIEQILDDQSGV